MIAFLGPAYICGKGEKYILRIICKYTSSLSKLDSRRSCSKWDTQQKLRRCHLHLHPCICDACTDAYYTIADTITLIEKCKHIQTVRQRHPLPSYNKALRTRSRCRSLSPIWHVCVCPEYCINMEATLMYCLYYIVFTLQAILPYTLLRRHSPLPHIYIYMVLLNYQL